jgi:TonB family protein
MKSILLITAAFCISQFYTNAQEASDSTKLPAPKITFTPISLVQEEISHYCLCGIYAQFPGGDAAMQKWVQNNTTYPRGARQLGIEGKVYIEFIVEKDGSISNVKVVKGAGYSLNQEAKRIIKSMPLWVGMANECTAVPTRVVIPISFILT